MRAKLRKQGKWNEEWSDKYRQTTLDEYTQPQQPAQVGLRDITDEEAAELGPIFERALTEAEGKSNYMSLQHESVDRDLSIRDRSITCISETGIIHKTDKFNTPINMEDQVSGTREFPGGDLSLLYEGRDIPGKVRKTKESSKGHEVKSGTGERGGTKGIPESTKSLRDKILIFDKDMPHPQYFKDYKKDKDWGDSNFWESYFQSYNSLGVVIKSLPDDNVTSYDVYNELCKHISDPFILISEKSSEGVLHWHMIWLTSKRSDNAKRSLETFLKPISTRLSIACQQTRSLKHLLKYILKDPISVGVAHSPTFAQYCYGILDNHQYVKPENLLQSSNPMIKDIIDAMQLHNATTSEQLFRLAPEVMLKYLHKPNLESVIANCRLFLLRPTDAHFILKRAVQGREGGHFLRIWNWLLYQDIDPGNFILDFWNILFRTTSKHNVLCLHGSSNTGKTTFIRPLLEILNFGEVTAGGQFMFQNCVNKELIIWEEPLIGPDYVEMCKRVFEGMITQVPVKFKPAVTLYRTPIIITTNKDVWYYCSSDESALRNRMIIYKADNPAADIPSTTSWRQTVYRTYNEWLADLGVYVSSGQPDIGDGSKLSQQSHSGTEYSYSQQLLTDNKCSCAVCAEQSTTQSSITR